MTSDLRTDNHRLTVVETALSVENIWRSRRDSALLKDLVVRVAVSRVLNPTYKTLCSTTSRKLLGFQVVWNKASTAFNPIETVCCICASINFVSIACKIDRCTRHQSDEARHNRTKGPPWCQMQGRRGNDSSFDFVSGSPHQHVNLKPLEQRAHFPENSDVLYTVCANLNQTQISGRQWAQIVWAIQFRVPNVPSQLFFEAHHRNTNIHIAERDMHIRI
jgi:hypothetical protein